MPSVPPLRLVPAPPREVVAPVLDDRQARVVAHRGGPLLVLGAAGTGKTTTLVEHVVARLAEGTAPERVLVLTGSRQAAVALRRRISDRWGRSSTMPAAMTVHAFCLRALQHELSGADVAPRLLTAPEQEFRVREALPHAQAQWPDALAPALPTRGFARELREVLARARQLGLDPEDLAELGEGAGRPEWTSAAAFFEEYLELLDYEPALDYNELVHRTRLLLVDPARGDAVRGRVDAVVIDEYQELDPAQASLVRLLVGERGELVAFADPDEQVYRFRGADPRVLATARRLYPGVEVVALGEQHRFGPELGDALGRLGDRLPLLPGVPTESVEALRRPLPLDAPSRVEVRTYESEGAQAAHLAHLLRSAHLHDGIPWDRMAVLVRQGRRTLPALGRALVAGGVPVEVAGDEIPLAEELAVRPLLLAVSVVEAGNRPDPDEARRLLLSPLGGLDSMGLRRLGRALRAAERAELGGVAMPGASADLVAACLADPALLDAVAAGAADADVAAARRLGTLLADVAGMVEAGAGPHEVLWRLWRETDWPDRLRRAALRGGDAGRQADRDLDAVSALLALASRKETTRNRGLRDLVAEVEGQQIPGDTQRDDGTRRQAVRLLTAHRAKGLEWDLVVVAGVQEGGWPDLRRQDGLLESRRLARDGISDPEPVTAVLAEERRLFHLACARARSRLVVTAVEGTEGEGDQPSRFLADLGVPVEAVTGRPRRPLVLPALVAELRRSAVDPTAHPDLRDAAARRLAVLAEATDDEQHPLVPAADPARWWGLAEPTVADVPVAAEGEPVRLSGSSLAGLLTCPRQWYLERQVHAERAKAGAQTLGSVVHVLAQHATAEEWGVEDLVGRLDEVWDQLPFDAVWLSASERGEAESALERFVAWDGDNPRELLGTEVPFDVEVDVPGDRVRLVGSVDRLERDRSGALHVVDLKTGKRVPSPAQVVSMEQLGVYQLAAQAGAFDDLAPDAEVGGAEAVYLREPQGALVWPTVRQQPSIAESPHLDESDADAPTWVHARLGEAARIVREGQFPAQRCEACSRCAFASSCPAVNAGRQVLS